MDFRRRFEARPKKLVEAAVLVVDGDEPPPIELRMAWQCQRWDALPDAGGMHDQDYQLLFRMTALLNVYDTVSLLRNMRGAEIHNLTTGQRKILKMLRDDKVL